MGMIFQACRMPKGHEGYRQDFWETPWRPGNVSQGWFPAGNPLTGIHDAMRMKPTLWWGTKDNVYARNTGCPPRKVAGTRWRWPMRDRRWHMCYRLQDYRGRVCHVFWNLHLILHRLGSRHEAVWLSAFSDRFCCLAIFPWHLSEPHF